MRAPLPTLICAGTLDRTFDIRGTWESFRQAKRACARVGFPERMSIVEADAPHGFSIELRVGSTRWMRRWLQGIDDAVTEPELKEFEDEDLYCTPRGQVMLLKNERSVFDLNSEVEKSLSKTRNSNWNSMSPSQQQDAVRETIGTRSLADMPELKTTLTKTIQRKGYTIEKRILYRDEKNAVPLSALVFLPETPNNQSILYLHGQGKQIDAKPGGLIEKLVNRGHIVMAVDLTGIGESERTENPKTRWASNLFGTDYHEFMLAYLLGKSYVAMRTEDILQSATWLAGFKNKPAKPVQLLAIGEAGVPALHAAALEPETFSSVEIFNSLQSWKQVVETPVAKDQLINVVHGALKVYDLPDLVEMIGDDNFRISSPLKLDE